MSGPDPLQNDSGGYGEEVTPVPIPNTEVKLFSADGTAWEAAWESRTPPDLFYFFFIFPNNTPTQSFILSRIVGPFIVRLVSAVLLDSILMAFTV